MDFLEIARNRQSCRSYEETRPVEKEKLDAVVYPSYLSTPLHARYDTAGTYWNAYAYPFLNNCRTLSPSTGLPEVSVPIGMHSLGAGIGMEIAALKNSEQYKTDRKYTEHSDIRKSGKNGRQNRKNYKKK